MARRRRPVINWCRRNWPWLKWLVALGLLGFLFYNSRAGLAELSTRRIDWFWFAVAFVVASASMSLTFFRWYLLVWAQEFPFRVRDGFRLGLLGYMFNYFGLGATGGDLIKGVWLVREQKTRKTAAIGTIVLDRVLGLLALFMVGAGASLMPTPISQLPQMKFMTWILWGGTLAGAAGLALMLHPATAKSSWLERLVHLRFVGRLIGEIVNAVLLYQKRPRILVAAVGMSLVGHFGVLTSFYFCSLAIRGGQWIPDYGSHLVSIPIAEVIAVFVPTPGGMGALEWAVTEFYRLANLAAGSPLSSEMAQANGLLTGAAFRVISIMIAMIGGIYYFSARQEITEAIEEAQHQREPAVATVQDPA